MSNYSTVNYNITENPTQYHTRDSGRNSFENLPDSFAYVSSIYNANPHVIFGSGRSPPTVYAKELRQAGSLSKFIVLNQLDITNNYRKKGISKGAKAFTDLNLVHDYSGYNPVMTRDLRFNPRYCDWRPMIHGVD